MTPQGLRVPDRPIVPFIEGDGTGPDITAAARPVWDAAVEKAYGGARAIAWMEVFAGEKALKVYGENQWLPAETLDAFREFLVGIKGPLTTPVGGGIRSLNVALRQELDLYVCLRPVRWFQGVPSPVKHPENTDMVIFRENTEDIYAGIEWKYGTPEAAKVVKWLREEMGVKKIRFPETASIGIKPVSLEGTERLVRAALRYAVENDRRSVTLVHKGNIQKFTEGAFRDWGYALAAREFGATPIDGGPWLRFANASATPSCSRSSRARPNTTSSRRSTSTATTSPTRSPPRWAASASRPARISTTRRASRCSRPRTAPRRSTRTSTRSTPARSSSPAR